MLKLSPNKFINHKGLIKIQCSDDVIIQVCDYYPYLVYEFEDVLDIDKLKQERFKILDYKIYYNMNSYLYYNSKCNILKLYFLNETDMYLFDNYHNNQHGMKLTKQDNISHIQRLVSERNLKYGNYLIIDNRDNKYQVVNKILKISYKDLYSSNDIIKDYSDNNIVYLDIETYASNPDNGLPNYLLTEDVIICISIRLNNVNHVFLNGKTEYKDYNNTNIYIYNSELCMLKDFYSFINEYNIHILTGYNIIKYDLEYIKARASFYNFKELYNLITPKNTYNFYNILKHDKIITIDILQYLYKNHKFDSYKLKDVSSKVLNTTKEDLNITDMFNLYKTKQDLKDVIIYNVKDVILCEMLFKHYDILNVLREQSSIYNVQLEEVLLRGQSYRVKNLLHKFFHNMNYIFNNNHVKNIYDYKGGLVLDPVKGLHKDVYVYDFKAQYPSLIIKHNICYTTLIHPNDNINKDDIESFDIDGNIISFVKPHLRKGVLPIICELLLQKRETNKYIKEFVNSIYGVLGSNKSDISLIQAAEVITYCSRKLLNDAIKYIETQGGTVLYGDTDSLMFQIDDISKIDEYYFKDMKFEYERKMIKVYFLQKKTYSYIDEDNNIHHKGSSTYKDSMIEKLQE